MNIEYAIFPVEGLEVRGRGGGGGRGGGRSIGGRFGYSPKGSFRRMATVRNRGRQRKEMVMSKAFGWSISQVAKLKNDLNNLLKSKASKEAIEDATQELAKRDIHVLSGHSFDKPLGSVVGGAVLIEEILEDEEDPYISFNVDLPEDESTWPSHMTDAVRSITAGLVRGISPGFLMPSKEKFPQAETFVEEPGNPEVLIRQINEAVLVEFSLVTRPVFTESEVTVRAEDAEVGYLKEGFRIWL